MLEEREWDQEAAQIKGEWTFVREGRVIGRNRAVVRLYTCRELTALFEGAGFNNVTAIEATTEEPLRLGSERALFRARAAS